VKDCVICGGSGRAPFMAAGRGMTRGPFADMTYSGVRECICKRLGAPVVHEDNCSRCHGWGIYGGLIGTQFTGVWKWCDCAAGKDRRQREPDLIEQANRARDVITKPKVRGKGLQSVGVLLDTYHGDF
jgi:hypothetical protein